MTRRATLLLSAALLSAPHANAGSAEPPAATLLAPSTFDRASSPISGHPNATARDFSARPQRQHPSGWLEELPDGYPLTFTRLDIDLDDMCDALLLAAQAHGLPPVFFARLIWQESRFNRWAVSPKGAKGLAQFMPATAADERLADPFDPLQALPMSARFLNRLHREFGNWGLAAAAYNGGPGRVRKWLEDRGKLPAETRNYVRSITGLSAEAWSAPQEEEEVELALPARGPCRNIPERETVAVAQPAIVAVAKPTKSDEAETTLSSRAKPRVTAQLSTTKPWLVQLGASWSERQANATLARLRTRHAAILADHTAAIAPAPAPPGGAKRMRVVLSFATRNSADAVCARLKKQGGACVVQKMPDQRQASALESRRSTRGGRAGPRS